MTVAQKGYKYEHDNGVGEAPVLKRTEAGLGNCRQLEVKTNSLSDTDTFTYIKQMARPDGPFHTISVKQHTLAINDNVMLDKVLILPGSARNCKQGRQRGDEWKDSEVEKKIFHGKHKAPKYKIAEGGRSETDYRCRNATLDAN